jgi:superfamily II DNA or RNA helicase
VAGLASTADSTRVRMLVGTEIFHLARELVDAGRVTAARWHEGTRRAFGEVRGEPEPRTAMVMADVDADGSIMGLRSHCTCEGVGIGLGAHCVHAAAVLLAALTAAEALTQSHTQARPATSTVWERQLAGLIPLQLSDELDDVPELALQFDVNPAGQGRGTRSTHIALRPAVPGAKGNWIRGNISWQNMHYAGYTATSARHLRLLKEILALFSSANGYYGYSRDNPTLETAPSRRIWDLLAEAVESGLPLVGAGAGNPPVILSTTPGEASLQIERSSSGLDLVPGIVLDGERIDLRSGLLIGQPAHGIAWWDDAQPARARALRLAALRGPVDPQFRKLLDNGTTIEVPSDDEARFLSDYVPLLRQQVGLTSASSTLTLPRAQPPVLTLTVERLPEHRLSLEWAWAYTVDDLSRIEPLWPSSPTSGRDRDAESSVIERVGKAARPVPLLFESTMAGRRLAPTATLEGIATIRFVSEVLPVLSAMDDVHVALAADGDAPGEPEDADYPDYRETDAAPLITIAGDASADDRDWFDLAVSVSVDGEAVPFNELFVALAEGTEHLILASGTYFSLDREEFHRLRALIAEARALTDVTGNTLRLSRFQAGLWSELEQIGVVSGQAATWQESVQALVSATDSEPHPVPMGLKATLRPYQQAGFTWLAALYDYRLGGILADDMGLGKTLQALALFVHIREHGLSEAPFLVVAPTSVVFNWAAEAARFAPGLRVATINETRSRRGASLSEAIDGADIVVTSYTLFRLEYASYEAVEWAGMVLDEAQFVKNHQSQSYQCVRKLPAPFKLAITGTPMENNLLELWSLLSITAPGLFPNPARFTEYYRTPIEKGKDAGLLDQLRRRIRPLMLRRTKEQVAADLPDKQEQVIELELNPQHRKVYQTHLQRERQKVLGLLDDMGKNRFEIFRSLTLLRQASIDAALIDEKYAKIPSTKLDAVLELVDDVVREGHRTLIFSQFTRFLSSVRDRLTEAGVETCYLDGSTRNRATVLGEFKTGTAPVFLISLKAGGFGLNLTEADYCILLDPWWNPATEAQAVDRVHRIGQTKKVMVYRLVAKGTIEEKVMALKAGKSALFSSVMDGGGFESSQLSAADIKGLLD